MSHIIAQNKEPHRPQLAVGIVVDQMRWDYLYRYYDRYEDGGFKRLLNEGFSCQNTNINYLPSYTAVGHTVVFTGSIPAITGIVSNNWIDQQTNEMQYVTEDHNVTSVGASGKVGEMSPRNMLTTTITDELRLATNFRSKVVGVSIKDRAAILPAGHTANGAFWYDPITRKFITSSYYMNELPEWVILFNDQKYPEKLVADGWNTLYPINTYEQSTEDNAPWEGKISGEKAPVFPHDMKKLEQEHPGSIRTSPFGNTLTLDFAKAAIEGYSLGVGNSFTDFLTINLASTDFIGHSFGPNSIEVEDNYLRLDRDLASFFTFLDEKIGKGQYVVFLTADHGASHSVDFLLEHQIPGGYENINSVLKTLNDTLSHYFGIDKMVTSLINYFVNYDMKVIRQNHLDFDKVKRVTIDYLKLLPQFQFVVDMDQVDKTAVPEPIRSKIINGYNYKRNGPIKIIANPGWTNARRGTTHGSWNPYDTHIPLIFMGWGINHGGTNRPVDMSDIAPTIAALLNIQVGNGNVGKPISEITNHR